MVYLLGSTILHLAMKVLNQKAMAIYVNENGALFKRLKERKMILIYIDTAYAYVLPVNKLDNPDTVFEFICEKYNKSLNQIGAENAPPG